MDASGAKIQTPGRPAVPKAPGGPRLGRNILTCATLFALSCAAFFLVVAYFISLTGLVEFPVLNRFYQAPVPSRQVLHQKIDSREFEALLSARIREQVEDRAKNVAITIDEKEVSGLLAWGLNQGLRNNFTIEQGQMAVLPAGLELFIKLKWSLGHIDLLVKIVPVLQADGSVKFEPVDAKLGMVNLPFWAIMPVISNVFAKDMGAWNLQAGDMKIKSLDLKDGKIIITFQS